MKTITIYHLQCLDAWSLGAVSTHTSNIAETFPNSFYLIGTEEVQVNPPDAVDVRDLAESILAARLEKENAQHAARVAEINAKLEAI
ncbi:MAG: hypothetical protein ACREBG_10785 [Pyrinomonadaceae bacterium]